MVKILYLLYINSFIIIIVTIDIDECQLDDESCAQTCMNTDGSFVCSCDAGFILAADNVNCEGMIHAWWCDP